VSERWRRKKAGQDDSKQGNQQLVTQLTELANRLLTKTGNMDIYQESYEHIAKLVGKILPRISPVKKYVHALLVCVSHYSSVCQKLTIFYLCTYRYVVIDKYVTFETQFVSKAFSCCHLQTLKLIVLGIFSALQIK
jgi:hypothetical protein